MTAYKSLGRDVNKSLKQLQLLEASNKRNPLGTAGDDGGKQPALGKQSLLKRLRALGLNLFSALAPWLMIPAHCPACRERLELSIDRVISRSQDLRVHGIRLWKCPQYAYRTYQMY